MFKENSWILENITDDANDGITTDQNICVYSLDQLTQPLYHRNKAGNDAGLIWYMETLMMNDDDDVDDDNDDDTRICIYPMDQLTKAGPTPL